MKKARYQPGFLNAEEEGFEPPVPCGTTVFKTAAFDHSATPLLLSINEIDLRHLFRFAKVDTSFEFTNQLNPKINCETLIC
jgi:hypothetical protein